MHPPGAGSPSRGAGSPSRGAGSPFQGAGGPCPARPPLLLLEKLLGNSQDVAEIGRARACLKIGWANEASPLAGGAGAGGSMCCVGQRPLSLQGPLPPWEPWAALAPRQSRLSPSPRGASAQPGARFIRMHSKAETKAQGRILLVSAGPAARVEFALFHGCNPPGYREWLLKAQRAVSNLE